MITSKSKSLSKNVAMCLEQVTYFGNSINKPDYSTVSNDQQSLRDLNYEEKQIYKFILNVM